MRSPEKALLCILEQCVRITFALKSHVSLNSGPQASLCLSSRQLTGPAGSAPESLCLKPRGCLGPHYHFCLGPIHVLLAEGRGA